MAKATTELSNFHLLFNRRSSGDDNRKKVIKSQRKVYSRSSTALFALATLTSQSVLNI